MMNTTKTVNSIVAHIGDLPTIPAVVSEVLQMTATPNTPLSLRGGMGILPMISGFALLRTQLCAVEVLGCG